MSFIIDIFYTAASLGGLFMFHKNRALLAAVSFGAASLFSVFPAIVFLPVLFVFERDFKKRLGPVAVVLFFLALGCLIPFGCVTRMPQVSMLNVMLFCAAYAGFFAAILATRVSAGKEIFVGAYVFMLAAVLPFLLVAWEPAWAIFCVAPVLMTSFLVRKKRRSLLIDLGGAAAFAIFVTVVFFSQHAFTKPFMMFSQNSGSVFFSVFWAYLAVQPILKFSLVRENVTLATKSKIQTGSC